MDELLKLLGPFPEKTELNAEVLEEIDCGIYIRQKVAYNAEANDRITAYLCLPKNATVNTPVIFCHHQHNRQFNLGKSEVMGLMGNPDQAYAKELAEKGYITFAPDAIAFEERQGGGEYFELATRLVKGKTLMAKVIHDVSIGIDYLASRKEINIDKLGFIGHSYGGKMALWMPAFDDRIKASASNGGCIDYRNALTPDTGIQMEFCIPGIMNKLDLEDIVATIKNCPVLILAGSEDEWSRGYQGLYDLLVGRGMREVELKVYEGGHEFSPEMRDYAYDFLAKNLG